LCYLQEGKLKNISEEKSMVNVQGCLSGGRDLWEKIFPPFAFEESEPIKKRQSGGCQKDGGSSGGCASSTGPCSQELVPPAPISAATKKEAVELSLKAFTEQLGAQFSHADFLTDRILELVGPNVSPAAIGEVIGAYLKRRDWRSAMAIAKKAGRELTDGEIQNGYAILADWTDLEGFVGLLEASGKKPGPEAYIRLISQVSTRYSSEIDWSKLVRVLDAGAPQEAIDQAVILCARPCIEEKEKEKKRQAGFEIIAGQAVSLNARQVFLGAFIDTGSIQQSQMVAQKIFGRELTTDEFCQATSAALRIAEKKRRQRQESYEAED
jgi:hypothetical protein